MSEFRPTDAELMQMVDWLASPEAGLKLPAEFLSPVSCAINLVRKQTSTIQELEKRIGIAEGALLRAQHELENTHEALTAERQRRIEVSEILKTMTAFTDSTGGPWDCPYCHDPMAWHNEPKEHAPDCVFGKARAYFSRYPSESDNRTKVAG